MAIAPAIPFYLLLVNGYVFIMMLYDKRQARKGSWRVQEGSLLFLSVLGGGFGGLVASRLARHKTKKVKFLICFMLGILIDVLFLWQWLNIR
ncbi:DUF1294 domain-containing protein [Vagococcus acidifermentans]|nr:DUF1294 domain-containing protein [Vagococcus acidifermentans]